MRVFCVCFLVLLNILGHSQRLVKGIVVDSLNRPLSKTKVFLNGTSFATTTDEQGRFSIRSAPGRYNLVATHTGFKTHHQLIDANDLPDSITLSLNAKSPAPATVSGRFIKTNWERWGEPILVDLIGDSYNSNDFLIKNIKAVHLYATQDESELLVKSDEPLIIQNRLLGYTVFLQLDTFYLNFRTLSVFQVGYTYFQSMDAGKERIKMWQEKRALVYYGSLMHFMRSVYLNRIGEEGFEVRRLTKVRNLTPTVGGDTTGSGNKITSANYNASSLNNGNAEEYEDQVLNPDNYKDVIGLPLTGDSIAYAVNKTTAGLEFNGFLLVVYRAGYIREQFQIGDHPFGTSSQLLLINGRPVEIESNGSYYDSADLLIIGDWLRPQPLSTMLPFDYVPPGK